MTGDIEVNGHIHVAGAQPAATLKDGRLSFTGEPRPARTEQEWARSRPSNIQHGQKRRRPVTRSAILIASSVLVLALAVVVDGVWRMVTP